MLSSHATIVLALSATVHAAPYTAEPRRWLGPDGEGSPDAKFYDREGPAWRAERAAPPPPPPSYQESAAGRCDLTSATLPQAPNPLPPVSDGFRLYHVAVGRGTQNYTCDLSNATATPAAAGAVASLFNVTCLSADSPALLARIPAIALQLPTPRAAPSDPASPVDRDLSGHHYFTDATTAYFDLDTARTRYGAGGFKKVHATAAPAGACAGAHGRGYGAVPWLKLAAKDPDDGCVFHEVFRINTAGGAPPHTCAGQDAAFEIEYSAEYWFYGPGV